MAWSINNIENQISKVEGNYVLTYSIQGVVTIIKHELSIDNGFSYQEITPVGNTTGFSITVEAKPEIKNCYLKLTDSEGNIQTSNLFTIQFLNPEANNPPVISDIKVQNINESGVYQITYNASDSDKDDILTHFIKIDNNDYVEISPAQNENTFTYNGIGLKSGTHVLNLKVSDTKCEVESPVFQVIIPNIINNPPILRNIKVEETSHKGRFKITYEVKDIDKTDLLTHKLKIDTNDYIEIKPISLNDIYTYNGFGLSIGRHECKLQIYDGVNTVDSEPFFIEINNEDGIGIKNKLFEAKTNYDNSYNSLIETIKSVILDMQNNKDYDSNIGIELINNSFKDYTEKSVLLKDLTQQAIDIIGNKKTSEAKENLSKEIGDLTNALGSLDASMNDVFKDGILTEAEKINIRQNLQTLSLEKIDVDNQYNSILSKFNPVDLKFAEDGIIPPDFNGEIPTEYPNKQWYLDLYNNFKNAYKIYDEKYKNLVLIIDYILKKDGILDSNDKVKMDKAFEEYGLAIGEYSKQANLAIEGIGRNETENNENLVKVFKGEYIRTNKENSATLSKLTQTSNTLTEEVSKFKQTADNIQLQVTKNTNGLATQSSKINQLSNEISLAVTKGEFGSLIKQNSNSIVLGLEREGLLRTRVHIGNNYVTVWDGYLACDKITSLPGRPPKIYLFGDKSPGKCQIDATLDNQTGEGTSIRLKYTDNCYIRVDEGGFRYYLNGIAPFNVNVDERVLQMQTKNLSIVPKNDYGVITTFGLPRSYSYVAECYSASYYAKKTSGLKPFGLNESREYDFFKNYNENIENLKNISLMDNGENNNEQIIKKIEDSKDDYAIDISTISQMQSSCLEELIKKYENSIELLNQELTKMREQVTTLETNIIKLNKGVN